MLAPFDRGCSQFFIDPTNARNTAIFFSRLQLKLAHLATRTGLSTWGVTNASKFLESTTRVLCAAPPASVSKNLKGLPHSREGDALVMTD